jgi:uncharacterized protein with HEPN domain
MKSRDIGDYLEDILLAVREVVAFTQGMTFEKFYEDRKPINAVIRSLEVMGEAAKKIPEDFRRRHPNIPRRRMAAMRDKVIHEYFGVDRKILWQTAQHDIPPLENVMEKIIAELYIIEQNHD